MRQASLFSGAAGMDYGGTLHGFDTVFACDWHKASKQFYKNNFPDVPFYKGDVRDVKLKLINEVQQQFNQPEITVGELDVLTAGSPCVKLAACNTVDGRQFAEENFLMVETLVDIVKELQPKIAWFENSDRLCSKKNKNLREELFASMDNLLPNYTRVTKVINAIRYGGYQTRSRAMTVLIRNDVLAGRKINIFPQPEKVNLFKQGAQVILPHIESFSAGQFKAKFKPAADNIFCTLTASGCEKVIDENGLNRSLKNVERMALTGMGGYNYLGITDTDVKMLLGNMVLIQISDRFFKHFKEVILQE